MQKGLEARVRTWVWGRPSVDLGVSKSRGLGSNGEFSTVL